MHKKTYTKQQKAEAVAIAEFTGSQMVAARETGVSNSTISRASRDEEITRIAKPIKEKLGVEAMSIAQKYLNRLSVTCDQSSTRDAAGAFKILIEGAQLLNNQPTQITESRSADPAALEEARQLFADAVALYGSEEAAREWLSAHPEVSQLLN